jgi:DNA-directed RNA polymerase specialized sigma24 family protein
MDGNPSQLPGVRGKFGTEEQAKALEHAERAASEGDVIAMIQELFNSYALDGLTNFLRRKWPGLPEDDRDSVVAEAVEDLRLAVKQGKKVRKLSSYLFRSADNRAYNIIYNRRPLISYAPEGDMDLFPTHEERTEVQNKAKREAFRIAREMVQELGGITIQRVMNFYIDAIERGDPEYLTSDEVGSILMLDAASVRKAKQRGFDRLRHRFLEHGLSPEVFQNYIDSSQKFEGEEEQDEEEEG